MGRIRTALQSQWPQRNGVAAFHCSRHIKPSKNDGKQSPNLRFVIRAARTQNHSNKEREEENLFSSCLLFSYFIPDLLLLKLKEVAEVELQSRSVVEVEWLKTWSVELLKPEGVRLCDCAWLLLLPWWVCQFGCALCCALPCQWVRD